MSPRWPTGLLHSVRSMARFFLRQVPFHLPGGVKLVVDFQVFWADGHVTFDEPKGCRTESYLAKKRMVESLYPITIEEY